MNKELLNTKHSYKLSDGKVRIKVNKDNNYHKRRSTDDKLKAIKRGK